MWVSTSASGLVWTWGSGSYPDPDPCLAQYRAPFPDLFLAQCLVFPALFLVQCLVFPALFLAQCLVFPVLFLARCLVFPDLFLAQCLVFPDPFLVQCLVFPVLFPVPNDLGTAPVRDNDPSPARTVPDTESDTAQDMDMAPVPVPPDKADMGDMEDTVGRGDTEDMDIHHHRHRLRADKGDWVG